MPKTYLLREILRIRLAELGDEYKEIARKAGLPTATCWRFLVGKMDLRLSTAEKLMAKFGLKVIETRPKRGRKGGQSRAKKG